MREATAYYQQATEKAWRSIQERLEIEKRKLQVSDVLLESVTFDRDSYISQIEELPDEPKAPTPDQLEVKIGIEAVYRVIR